MKFRREKVTSDAQVYRAIFIKAPMRSHSKHLTRPPLGSLLLLSLSRFAAYTDTHAWARAKMKTKSCSEEFAQARSRILAEQYSSTFTRQRGDLMRMSREREEARSSRCAQLHVARKDRPDLSRCAQYNALGIYTPAAATRPPVGEMYYLSVWPGRGSEREREGIL